MKVLIYGHGGWIGKQFLEILKNNNIDFFCGFSRIDDEKEVIQEIINIKPTHVIAFIGRTHGTTEDGKVYTTIDYLEQKGKIFENVRDNLFSPMCLALLAQKNNIHFTYLGTGCIFEYDDDVHKFENDETGFTEEDNPNFR